MPRMINAGPTRWKVAATAPCQPMRCAIAAHGNFLASRWLRGATALPPNRSDAYALFFHLKDGIEVHEEEGMELDGMLRKSADAPAPTNQALAIANWPTGPEPNTATVEPAWMSARAAPNQPVGRRSDTRTRDRPSLCQEPSLFQCARRECGPFRPARHAKAQSAIGSTIACGSCSYCWAGYFAPCDKCQSAR
jgi:hypothetical protein